MRAGGAQWGARAALAVVSATLIAGSARAEPIEVVAPPDIGGVVTAWPLGDGSTDTRQSSAVEPGGVAVIRVPKETPQRYVIRFKAEDGRVWRVVLSGADRQEWPERHEIAAESLYQPASVDLLFNVPGWGRMPLISVLIRESDDYSRSSILRPAVGARSCTSRTSDPARYRSMPRRTPGSRRATCASVVMAATSLET